MTNRQGHAQASRCLGREAELSRILTGYEEALGGIASFFLVTGSSGVGKSTFLVEAVRRLRDRGALILEARCRPGLPSYRPLLEVVRGALGQLCETSAGEGEILSSGNAMLDLLGGRPTRSLARRHLSIARGDEASPAPSRRISFFDQLAELLAVVSTTRPTVVLLQDLNLADPGTLEVARFLGRALASRPELGTGRFRGLFLASSDTTEVLDASGGWSEALHLDHIDLGGLDESGVRAFLSSEEVVQRVLSATGGLPRLLEVMVGPNETPRKLPAPLEGRHPSEVRLLKVLALLGRPAGPETIRLLTGLPHDRLARCLTALTERHLIEKVVVDGEIRLEFARSGDQAAIGAALEEEERRELHGEIGTFLEGLGDEELEACAEHLLRAHVAGRAVRLALAAGEQLEIAFCFERAIDLYERALSQADPAMVAEVEERLCSLCQTTGNLDRALDLAKRRLAAAPQDLAAAHRVAHLHLARGDYATARQLLLELAAAVEREQASPALAIDLLADLAETHHLAGDPAAALALTRRGLELCATIPSTTRTDLVQPRMTFQNIQAKIHLEREEIDAAHDLFSSNLALARAASQPGQELRWSIQLGLIHLRRGEHDLAEDCYQRACDLARRIGELRYLGICLQHLGVLAERRGAYGIALERYQESVAVLKRVGHRSFLALVGLDLGGLYLKLGDPSRARTMAELAERLLDGEPPLVSQVLLDLLRGRIARRDGNCHEATERFSRARTRAVAAEHRELECWSLLELADLALEHGEPASAIERLGELGPLRQEPLRLRQLLLRARAALSLQDSRAAQEHLEEAIPLAAQLGDAEAAWRLKHLMGLLARLQGRRSDARRLLAEAATAEEKVRGAVPEEFRQLMAELPARLDLRRALREAPAGAEELLEVEAAPRPTPRSTRADRGARNPWRQRFGAIIGAHRRMQQVYEQIERVAPTDATVLIRGESGTGKELIAEAIHGQSQRGGKSLIKVNCGALVESLLLSELFGHERGAFTGAMQRKKGRFELADGGTIFLDEIGDVSPKTQVALLRVLQEREFERVGGTAPIHVDVRIICATNKDLDQMVRSGEFREDLYYRLNGVRLEVPPLRDRIEDLPLLVDTFLTRIAKERATPPKRISADALALLGRHAWPGNVRELENVLRSVSLFSDSDILDVEDFADYPELSSPSSPPSRQREAAGGSAPPAEAPPGAYDLVRSLGWSLRDYKKHIEVECITEALGEAEGNITRAAELLGMKRPRLSQLIKEHGIAIP